MGPTWVGPVAQGLAVGLAGPADVGSRDGREGEEAHVVDLDADGTDGVAAPDLALRPLPEPEGHGDVAGRDVVVELAAELHVSDPIPRSEARERCPKLDRPAAPASRRFRDFTGG